MAYISLSDIYTINRDLLKGRVNPQMDADLLRFETSGRDVPSAIPRFGRNVSNVWKFMGEGFRLRQGYGGTGIPFSSPKTSA